MYIRIESVILILNNLNNSYMNNNEILVKLQNVFRDVFDNEGIEINVDTVAEDIDEWDSLAHIQLVNELEKEFKIRLSAKEILSWDNVGEMIDAIAQKLN